MKKIFRNLGSVMAVMGLCGLLFFAFTDNEIMPWEPGVKYFLWGCWGLIVLGFLFVLPSLFPLRSENH